MSYKFEINYEYEERKEILMKQSVFLFLVEEIQKLGNGKMSIEKFNEEIKEYNGFGIALPSGRWGNILAVALEMYEYEAALMIAANYKLLKINLKAVSWISDKEDVIDFETCYNNSIIYYDNYVSKTYLKDTVSESLDRKISIDKIQLIPLSIEKTLKYINNSKK